MRERVKQDLYARSDSYQTIQPDRTRPHVLKRLVKLAALARLRPGNGQPLPLQEFVRVTEDAGVEARAQGDLAVVAAVANEVMDTDARLTTAEDRSRATASDLATAEKEARKQAASAGTISPLPRLEVPAAGQPIRRRRLINPFLEWPALAGIAGGESALTYLAARVTTLGPTVRQLFTLAVGIASVFTAQVAARCLDQLGLGPDGKEDHRRRQWLDVGVGALALASGSAIVLAVARMREAFLKAVYDGLVRQSTALVIDQGYLPWLLVLGVALLGLGTTVAYAAIPDRPGVAAQWWKALVNYFLAMHWRRRDDKQQQADWAAQQARLGSLRQAAAEAIAEDTELRAALAQLVTTLRRAVLHALMSRRVQADVGDAAQFKVAQDLAEQISLRRLGFLQRIKARWRGQTADVPDTVVPFTSLAATEDTAAAELSWVIGPAMEVLERRGLLKSNDPMPLLAQPASDTERLKAVIDTDDSARSNGKSPHPPSITAREGMNHD
jgi:hypothetical protein